MSVLENFEAKLTPPDEAARQEAQRRWDAIAKPLGSLGLLETALTDIAALTGDPDYPLEERTLLVFCADNGVVAQGVTQTGSEVTAAVARNLAAGVTAACRMADLAQCRVVPVDMGVKGLGPVSGVLGCRVADGTADITQGPAMSRSEMEKALLTGIGLVKSQKEAGARLLLTGEMGIGNTTTASAVVSVLLGEPPARVTGKGSGLSAEGLRRKVSAIEKAIGVNRPDPQRPLEVLQKLGGLDIAAMTGVFLGGALYQVPVLIDGFISGAAALCAARFCPAAKGAMLASHVSAEPAGALVLGALGKSPLLCAGMRLGEGTGALAVLPLLDMAREVYTTAATFQQAAVEAYQPL